MPDANTITAGMVFTTPPYDVNYGAATKDQLRAGRSAPSGTTISVIVSTSS